MRATARVFLDTVSSEQRYRDGLGDPEVVEITGTEADDWETAKASVEIPAGAMIAAWIRT